jgi:hypothetical protein
MPLCHCFSHSLVFTFASADPTHDIKQYFTERKPIVSRRANDQAVDRFRKNGSFGHVRADLFGAKDYILYIGHLVHICNRPIWWLVAGGHLAHP